MSCPLPALPIRSAARAGAIALLAASVALLAGCASKIVDGIVHNELPTVRITAAPIDTMVACVPDPVKSCYSLTLRWVGHDPDGRVDHYLYAVDPPAAPGADTVWQVSHDNQERLVFPSRTEMPRGPNQLPIARDFHVFAIKAVDDRGAEGPVVARSFFSFTQAPDVYLTSPLPSHLSTPLLVPSVRFSWTGSDADGVFHDRPVKYKYVLLNESSPFSIDSAIANPDGFRAAHAPEFAGWDSVGGDTTTASYTNLTPNQRYLFVVVGFDEAGAYSPIFNLNTNMLRFRVGYTGVLGPKISMFNEFFNYTWRGEHCPTCPTSVVSIEVPANKRIVFNWYAMPPIGASMRCYRWAIDMDDVNDETPRSDEETDVRRWSACGINNLSATIGPFTGTVFPDPPEEHRLYVQGQDDLGLRSLAMVRFQVVRASLIPGSVLVVKDTRLKPDNLAPNSACVGAPLAGVLWPNQAELDTFLFARGGNPWRCVPGAISPPGLFAAYDVDTLGTRIQKSDLTVRLSRLSLYEHVIWMVDPVGASYQADGSNNISPQTALRYMSAGDRFNTLGAYVKQGGKVWLTGGGAARAATINWDNTDNNNSGTVFSAAIPSELGPGRPMFELARWKSQFRSLSFPADPQRFTGRFEKIPATGASAFLQYRNELPARFEFKTRATDPLPPTRTRPSDFYRTVVTCEFLDLENKVVENLSSDPENPFEDSALDTLYAEGGVRFNEDRRILMTYYHGPVVPQGFLFSGFDLWMWQRSQCQALVDFVLTRIWDVPRRPLARAHASRPGERARDRRPVAAGGDRLRTGAGR